MDAQCAPGGTSALPGQTGITPERVRTSRDGPDRLGIQNGSVQEKESGVPPLRSGSEVIPVAGFRAGQTPEEAIV